MALAARRENWLIFVDTNIMLDFYRTAGERVERQIAGLERHLNSIIVTEQVKMEFLKNRQKTIVDALQKIAAPAKLELPMIVTGSRPADMLRKAVDQAGKRHKELRQRVQKILTDPGQSDPVYQGLNRIFASDHAYNLKRPNKLRFQIRRLAWKRFMMGYPPRKASDTSIGDAINWEWIIHCAQSSTDNHHVLIVSRDSDYGVTYPGGTILNDWLRSEFKLRVSQKRKIELTNRLTVALKKLDENVTAEDEAAEDDVISNWLNMTTPASPGNFERFLSALESARLQIGGGSSDDGGEGPST